MVLSREEVLKRLAAGEPRWKVLSEAYGVPHDGVQRGREPEPQPEPLPDKPIDPDPDDEEPA